MPVAHRGRGIRNLIIVAALALTGGLAHAVTAPAAGAVGPPPRTGPPVNGTLQVNGKCLDIIGAGSTADGTLVDIWDCNGGVNQNWALP